MPRKDKQTPESLRWPKLFGNPEQGQSLFQTKGWEALLLDLKAKAEELSHKIIHEVPVSMDDAATQNFYRGKVAAYEDLLGIAEELGSWRDRLK